MSGKPKTLVVDAWRPSISPDGKKLLFFGGEKPMEKRWLPTNWIFNPSYSPLCIAKRNGTERKALTVFSYYPQIHWFGDSERILTFVEVEKDGYYNRLEEWDLETRRKREIWNGKGRFIKDDKQAREKMDSRFDIIGLSADEKTLFVRTWFSFQTMSSFMNVYDSENMVWKLDLAAGESQRFARFFNNWGTIISSPN